MKTVAIIAEYNPFHNGHKYHLDTAKKLTGADYAVALMSGSFLQRGHAAMWDKYTRAKMCVTSGIDLALELPFPYATGSAMDFANGAVNILNRLGSIDYLCFGAETADISAMNEIADILISEPDLYKLQLKAELGSGKSFPAARESALTTYTNDSSISGIVASPNNILAIEYLCALKRTGSSIKPVSVERKNSGYHDPNIYRDISSATAIRNSIKENILDISSASDINSVFSSVTDDIPKNVLDIITSVNGKAGPVFNSDLTPFLQGKLLSASDFNSICDINRELADKLLKLSPVILYDTAIELLNTRETTAGRISRSLIHLILGYTNDDRKLFIENGYAAYANILALKKESSPFLRELNLKSSIPLITKKADFQANVNTYPAINKDVANRLWELDTKATELYNCLIFNRYQYKNTNDYNTKFPVI